MYALYIQLSKIIYKLFYLFDNKIVCNKIGFKCVELYLCSTVYL